MTQDLLYNIALTQVKGIGAVQAKILLEHFGNAENIFKANIKQLSSVEGIGEIKAKQIKEFNAFSNIEKQIAFIHKHQIQAITLQNPNYPQKLLHCYDAPTLLFYKGSASLNNQKIISIIGTRNNTDYGKQITEDIIEVLKPYNVLIVSGLAYGIDAIAHKAAIKNNLPTVAILAHGLDSIYPAQHKTLAKEMLQNGGGLLTEFMHGVTADKFNFPQRNRIVAGMADATIVIETAHKGGSIITAELAYNYNKDVFAIPGRIYDNKSSGCLKLIQQQKAILLATPEQIIEDLGWQEKTITPKKQKELFITLTPEEEKIVALLQQKETTHIDEIYLKTGLSSSSVAAAILSLELQNVIVSLPGKIYKLM